MASLSASAQAKTKTIARTVPVLDVYQAVDARMRQIPDSSTHTVGGLARYINASFSTETDKARAAFGWVARNIRYDTENMYTVSFAEEPTESARKTLATRTGVCRDYAALYNAVVGLTGLKSYVVVGYTKERNGRLALVGHAWCATRINDQWYFMDPTWSAGYVADEEFVPRFTNDYFKAAPARFIGSHMPYDPLWQLLPNPLTPKQFQQGAAPTATTPAFSFLDSLAVYAKQTPVQQLRAINRRVELNGVKNDLTFSYLSHNYVEAYNKAIGEYNLGINQLNDFVEFFNHQFLPRKTDTELQQLLPPIAASFTSVRELMATVRIRDSSNQNTYKQMEESLREAEAKLTNCQAFLERYLHTGKLLRPTLFMNFSNINGRNEMMR